MSARWLGLLLLPWAAAASAAVTTLDFDGSVPIGAQLTRASPALDGRGAVVPADAPRFQVGAVTAGATLVRALPLSDSVIGAGQVGGVTYTLVRLSGVPALTTGEPGADPQPAYLFPDASVIGRFGYPGAFWGFACAAEIFPDGVVVLHMVGSGPEFRQMTLRTSVASFSDPNGFSVVRVSVYRPPSADVATVVGAAGPRRPVFLPHLGVWVSTVSEYTQTGLVSSAYPGAGRALGYASIDEGLTWQLVIDSDLDVPDRTLHPVAKHMHHLEPFEWFDAAAGEWKIGVIAVLGDAPNQGQVIARSHDARLPDLPGESWASLTRWKVIGVDQLTDLFPLNSSGTPSGGPEFLSGTDASQAGVAKMTLNGDAETDAVVFRPTVTLARRPFVLQLNRLATGAIVAPTCVFLDSGGYFAEGIWTSDPQGRYWTTAYHAHHLGFRGVQPVGSNRFWTLAARDDGAYFESALFELPGPPSIRSSLRLEPPATDVPVSAPFAASGGVSVTAESGVAPPAPVGAQYPILRVRSESLLKGQRFDSLVPQNLTATAGQSVQLSFWVKSQRADLGVASFNTRLDLYLPSGAARSSDIVPVKLDLDDWTPVVVTVRVPAAGIARAAAAFWADEDASPSRPLDYYFTEPQFVVSDQSTIATVRRAAATAGDQLTVPLPPLQSDWSVAVWATEAPTFVLSLLADGGIQAIVQQSKIPSATTTNAPGSTFDFSFTTTPWVPTLIGSFARRNVVVPTQDLVVVTQSLGRLTLHVSRGMGPFETVEANAPGFTPTELRFGMPEWERQFEGTVHRVKIWDDVALDAAGVEAERVSIPPPAPPPRPPTGCGVGPELVLLLPALLSLRGLRTRARGTRSRPASSRT